MKKLVCIVGMIFILFSCKKHRVENGNIIPSFLRDSIPKNFDPLNYHGDAYVLFNPRFGAQRFNQFIMIPILHNLEFEADYKNLYEIGDSNFINMKVGGVLIYKLMESRPEIVENFNLCSIWDTLYIKKIYIDYQKYSIHNYDATCFIKYIQQEEDSSSLNKIIIYDFP